ATSVEVEWNFSQGHVLIPHLCNRLWAYTICALMCFSDWSHSNFVSNEELL
ncbi:hypothetical protein GYMLUDRAFT_104352, partial [Collybiopsis luxurians FD-317 M1]